MKQANIKNFFQTNTPSSPSPKTNHELFTMYFDGGSRGNPGQAGSGFVIYDSKQNEIYAAAIPIPDIQTNNFAEYTGLVYGLEKAIELGITNISVKGDSELVIKQMLNIYKVKNENIKNLSQQARKYATQFQNITFEHVRREQNKRADQLSNQAMDSLS